MSTFGDETDSSLSMLDEIDAAATDKYVVIGTGRAVNRSPRYHEPAFNGAMGSDCGSFSERQDAQRLKRKDAEMHGFDACQRCFGGWSGV